MKPLFKPIILILLLFSVFSGISQSIPDDNKKIVTKLFLEVWNKKDFSELDKIWGDSVELHFGSGNFHVTATDLINLIESWHQAFPDFQFKINHIIAEDDVVAINVNYEGTQSKKFMNIEPLNNNINVSEMMFFKLKEGQLVEAWELYDELGMQKQMKGEH
jgi:predicted ester cyclase